MEGITEFLRQVLDKWIKSKSGAYLSNLKEGGAVLTELEEHQSRRSFEVGVIEGLKFAANFGPTFKLYLNQMQRDIIADSQGEFKRFGLNENCAECVHMYREENECMLNKCNFERRKDLS